MDSVLRYEDFSASPHAGARGLLNFLGMEVDQGVLEFLRESTTKKTSNRYSKIELSCFLTW